MNVGIAEQNGAGLAAGLATCGKIPFVVTYAVFGSPVYVRADPSGDLLSQPECEDCLLTAALPPPMTALPISVSRIWVFCAPLPNMTVIMPADYWSARKLVAAAAEMNGPRYLRFTRDAIPVIYDENTTFEIGKANLLKDGKDVVSSPTATPSVWLWRPPRCWLARESPPECWICTPSPPGRREAVKACVNDIGKIITVEDHNIINGLGGAVCEVVAEMGKGQVKRVGIQDQFGQSAPMSACWQSTASLLRTLSPRLRIGKRGVAWS